MFEESENRYNTRVLAARRYATRVAVGAATAVTGIIADEAVREMWSFVIEVVKQFLQ